MSDLTDAIEAAADALTSREWHFPNTVVSADGKYHAALPAYDIVRTVLAAAAPPIEAAARADERAKVAEEIAADILARLAAIGLRPTPWADGYTLASQYAAAVSRKHAANGPQIDPAAREGGRTAETTTDGPNAAETPSGRFGPEVRE